MAPTHRPSYRLERINDMIQQQLALLLLREVNDPRLQQLTISGVEASPDLSHAKIYFVIPEEAKLPSVEKALAQAQGFLRSALAKACQLRMMPQLHFYYDPSFSQGEKIDQLIAKALKS
jgi:ribosome-binding factor A